MSLQVELLEESFAAVAPEAAALADRFYANLFGNSPEVQPLFAHVSMPEQKKKLLASLKLVVENVRRPDILLPVLEAMGQKHVEYGVEEEHYPLVGDALLKALAETAGDAWTPAYEAAWSEAYTQIAGIMISAATVAV